MPETPNTPPATPAPLLAIRDATLVRNGAIILDALNLSIPEGQHTAILGPNGSGKSSLLRLITRQLAPLAHEDGIPAVAVFGRARWDVFALRRLLGIVSADLDQAFAADTSRRGLEAVLSGFFASQGLADHHAVSPQMREKAFDALAQADALPLAATLLARMSTGEARRILIARALVSSPRALLLDEPTAGLDPVARRRFLETLRRLARSGKTILLITHHVEEVLPEMQRIVLMRQGRIYADGPKPDVLTSETLSAVYGARLEVQTQGLYYNAVAGDPDSG